MTAHQAPHPTYRRALIGMLLVGVGVAGVAACGSDDDSSGDTTTTAAAAVCTSLDALGADVDSLTSIDAGAGEGIVAEVESSLESIKSDLEAVSADAAAELSDPIADLQASVDTLSDDVATAKASGDPTVAGAQSLLDSAAAVSSSWVVVKAAAPDCDL